MNSRVFSRRCLAESNLPKVANSIPPSFGKFVCEFSVSEACTSLMSSPSRFVSSRNAAWGLGRRHLRSKRVRDLLGSSYPTRFVILPTRVGQHYFILPIQTSITIDLMPLNATGVYNRGQSTRRLPLLSSPSLSLVDLGSAHTGWESV